MLIKNDSQLEPCCSIPSKEKNAYTGMYAYCIGNVDKRGIVYGKNIIATKYKKYKYFVKLDIRKFYPSVNAEILYEYLESKIKDKKYLKLCRAVLSQNPSLPIGSYYSQWLSNYFLEDLDYYIKQQLGVGFYIRYVDDMLLMDNDKERLEKAIAEVNRFLISKKDLCLKNIPEVKERAQNPIDFLGFRFTNDKILLRTDIFKKLNKRVKKIRTAKHVSGSQARSLISYLGWLSQIPSGRYYYSKHIKAVVKKGTLRKIISNST